MTTFSPNAQPTRCPHCSASLKSFWHRLSPGLVSILIKAVVLVHSQNQNRFHYRDLNLNYSEASNLQKLRFHALIAHADKENLKSGYWLITGRGGQFLRGEIAVPVAVRTFRNEVQEHSTELVHINQFRGKVPEFQSEFASRIERPEPARVPAGVLF